jgi:signal transduction histidine kinase
MSRYVQFERIREKAESLVQDGKRHEAVDRRSFRRLEHELNVRGIELELQREAIESTENKLEQWIADRTAELEAANRSLKAEIKVRAAIENRLRQNRERLRSLASQLEDVEERERRRIAANLHDLIGQTLASANMKLGLLSRTADDEQLRGELDEVRKLNQRMLEETRNIITELSPPVLDEQDMRTAAKWLVDHFQQNHGLDIAWEEHLADEEFAYDLRRFLFRTLRELLFNVIKHARTTEVTARLTAETNYVELAVADSGTGFDPGTLEYSEGFGLFSLRERVEAMGGSVDVSSAAGAGTRVVVVLPRVEQ